MGRRSGAVHVVRVRKSHVDKHGVARQYESAYLRRTWREDGKVRNETVANLSVLPEHVIQAVESSLKGHQLVPADAQATIVRSLPHGDVAAVAGQAQALGLPAILGPASFSPPTPSPERVRPTTQGSGHRRMQTRTGECEKVASTRCLPER